MVWDQEIKLMVMLCQQESDASNECLAYWEEINEKAKDDPVHNITVTKCRIQADENLPDGVVKRILTISDGTREK